jgi:hypothetical protein
LSRQCTARIAARSACARGQRDDHLPVEPARPQQRRVQHFGPVGGTKHHDPRCDVETVHLRQQLVERLLALVVKHSRARARPALADRVDLVHEDDRRGGLAGLCEQIAHPRGADADEQLHEAGPGYREERSRSATWPGKAALGFQVPAVHLRTRFCEPTIEAIVSSSALGRGTTVARCRQQGSPDRM